MLKELYAKYGQNISLSACRSTTTKQNGQLHRGQRHGLAQPKRTEKWKQTEISKQYNHTVDTGNVPDRPPGQIILSTVMIEKLAAKLKELHEL